MGMWREYAALVQLGTQHGLFELQSSTLDIWLYHRSL